MAASSSSLLNSPSALFVNRKRVHDKLTRGRERADRLRVKLCEANDGGDSAPLSPSSTAAELLSAQSLVGEIIETFTQSLLMLNGGNVAEVVSSQVVPARGDEDSGDSCKTPAHKDRRGSYKRRRTSKTYTRETLDSFEDGHAWRKYGQKKILDSKYPRHYYRCTHKYDQLCQAKKQVQQIQENPSLYRTTYEFHHTCSNLNTTQSLPHQLFTTTTTNNYDDSSTSLIWNFQLRPIQVDTVNIRAPSPFAHNNHKFNDVDYYISHAEDHRHLAAVSSVSDHRGDVISNSEVYSSTASTHSSALLPYLIDGVDSTCDFDDFLMDGLS